jgi:tyrosinase
MNPAVNRADFSKAFNYFFFTLKFVMVEDIVIRKSVNSLTDHEKKDFIEAILALKAKPGDFADTKYDEFVLWHARTMASPAGTDAFDYMRNLAHAGPIFLPWHREFLWRFEQALRHEVPGVFIPYWNWEEEAEHYGGRASEDYFKNSNVWRDDFMGGDGDPNDNDIVKTGPFKNWATVEVDQHTAVPIGNSFLTRTLGRDPYIALQAPELLSLPNQTDVYNALKYDFYDTPYWDRNSRGFRNALEGWIQPNLHNRVHVWVGGSMGLNTSPNDPIFFLNHCNVDRIWAIWQTLQVTEQYPLEINDRNNKRIDYYNIDDKFYYPTDEQDPRTIRMVLNHLNLRYTYEIPAVSVSEKL